MTVRATPSDHYWLSCYWSKITVTNDYTYQYQSSKEMKDKKKRVFSNVSFRKSNGRFAKIQLRAQTQRRTIITGGIQTYTANMSQLVKGFEKLFSKETEIKRVIN